MFFLVVILLTVGSISVARGTCLSGQFHNGEQCQTCSKECPPNQLIKVPCVENRDVICRPFREFINFNQLNGIDYDSSEEKHVEPVIRIEEIPAISKDEGEYWRNLAFALIGVLCALVVVATIIVLFACRKLRGTISIKQGPDEEDYDEQDSGYVVIRQIHRLSPLIVDKSREASSRHEKMPWLYRPKRRLLTECVDDVFESEDSVGSRVSRKLSVIHEGECNCDGDA